MMKIPSRYPTTPPTKRRHDSRDGSAQAQRRIVAAIRHLSSDPAISTAFVAYGAVGTLLYCDLMGIPISRAHDQPGQGSYFEFDPQNWTANHNWHRIEPKRM